MAIFKCTFRSIYLGNDTGLNIILPDRRPSPPKVLYLLHGYKQSFESWLSMSSVARYSEGKNLAVIMPDGGRSFYTDMVMTGENYYSYITRELPRFLRVQLGLEPERENTAVAGLSMGGYGALKIGLGNPDSFCAVAAFSPACDIVKVADENPKLSRAICGDAPVKDSKNDLYRLARELCASNSEKPKIYHYCGDEDFMLEENLAFCDFMRTQPLEYEYFQEPGGHEWALWDKWVKDFIEKFAG